MRRATPPPRRLSPPALPPARLRWCHFELRTASIVKHACCLWDLSLHKEGTPLTLKECEQTLKSSRPPLTSPEQMARELREKKFTNDADIGVVASLYEVRCWSSQERSPTLESRLATRHMQQLKGMRVERCGANGKGFPSRKATTRRTGVRGQFPESLQTASERGMYRYD